MEAFDSKTVWVDERSDLDWDKCFSLLYTEVSRKTNTFSDLEKRLIQVGKAMLLKPKILVIDNNFFDLSDIHQRFVSAAIFKNLSESTVVAIVDDFDLLSNFDRVMLMNKGAIVKDSPLFVCK